MRKEDEMNWDQVKGNWKQFRGQVKQQWGKLTDDDLTQINGKREELVGRLQKHYGYEKIRRKKSSSASAHRAICEVAQTTALKVFL